MNCHKISPLLPLLVFFFLAPGQSTKQVAYLDVHAKKSLFHVGDRCCPVCLCSSAEKLSQSVRERDRCSERRTRPGPRPDCFPPLRWKHFRGQILHFVLLYKSPQVTHVNPEMSSDALAYRWSTAWSRRAPLAQCIMQRRMA